MRSRIVLLALMISLFCGAGCFSMRPVYAAGSNADDAAEKLPRFVMLASPEVNLRTGPGTRYPIDWVIRRKGLPVEIVQEFEHWRKARTQDGSTGWAHKVMLNHYRGLIVSGKEPQNLYAKPDTTARVQARVEPEVTGRLERCRRDWCEAKIQGFEGWLPKTSFWGAYKDETFDD